MTGFTFPDIVILGATPGGITAAIAAARLGKTSVLVERTPYIGGLPANGLGATDIATRGATGGLFLEFVRRIKTHYIEAYGPDSDQVRDCDDGYHFEPSVAEQVFHKWLLEYPEISIVTKRQFDFEPESVIKRGNQIVSIRVTNLDTCQVQTIHGRFFLDCTYEGDLIAASGVPFFVGREGKEIYGEVGAGRLYKYWGGPHSYGSTHCGDNAVQAYNYRLCVTDDPERRVEITRPANYNREEFVSLIYDVKTGLHTGVDVREISQDQIAENLKRAEQNLPPIPNKLWGINRLLSNVGLPNNKADGNNQHFAFISTDLPEENWPYVTSGWDWRDRFSVRLRQYTEGLLYFAQNDVEVPAWFRENCRRWGWAADEYVDNGHFPRQLYVREGRRMKGKYIFTATDVLANGVQRPEETTEVEADHPSGHSTTITASHYALDSHAVRKREPGRVHLDGFFSYRCPPYSVPFGVMVPDAPLTNLLAPVPVSATHVGFSTLRMEPCWMALGQAAGLAAALCIDAGVDAENVEIDDLQLKLLDQGAVLIYDPRLWEDGVGDEERKKMQWEWLKCIKSRK
ncbi:Fc.00g082610.m01.CDS01 [Cosmosporella sp. VM-42]